MLSCAQINRAPSSQVGLVGLTGVGRRALENRLQKWRGSRFPLVAQRVKKWRGRRGRACPAPRSAVLGTMVSWLELHHAVSRQLRDFLKGGNWVTCIFNPPA